MRKDEGKFLCDKCGMKGISSTISTNPRCHICNDGTIMRQVGEPEYSHGTHGNPIKDKEKMTVLEYLQLLEQTAKLYRDHAISSIARNKHMNRLDGICDLTQNEIDAVLVDFINYCALCSGGDYGLKASDLGPEVPVVGCPSHAAQQQIDLENLPVYELIEDDEEESGLELMLAELVDARKVSKEEKVILGYFEAPNDPKGVYKVMIEYIGDVPENA